MGLLPQTTHFLERFFNGATSQRVCLYLEPLESYKALKLTTLGGAPGGGTTVPCCTFLEKSRRASVQLWLTGNAVTYRFRYIRGYNGQNFGSKFGILGISGGTALKRGDFLFGTDMYHHAKFYADRCHVAEIPVTNSNKKYKAYLISNKSHTSVAFVDKNRISPLR